MQKHLTMSKHTGLPVILAVYQRDGDNHKKSLYMIEIEKIEKEMDNIETVERDNIGICLHIPLRMTKVGFKLLETYKKKF